MSSIRNRLLLWQTLALLVAAAVVSLVTYLLAWDGFNQLRDYTLEQIALTVAVHTADEDPPRTAAGTRHQVSQIWTADGRLIYASREGQVLPRQPPGNHEFTWQGEEWHSFTVERDGRTIMAANTEARRMEMFARISRWLLIPLALLIAILGALFWIIIGISLRPLAEIRRELALRDAADLAPLPATRYPAEIAPMVQTLDQLLGALSHAMSARRRFIADAAHELRTPLTAIKLQTQVALASQGDADRLAALEMLRASVDRATHLVEQLLRLARLEPEAGSPRTRTTVALDQLAREVVGELSGIAEARGIDLGVGECVPATIVGDPDGLRAMLSNLVDNALRYGKPGGRVDVEVGNTEAATVLSVTDDGPGIPANQREAVFGRFVRLEGAKVPGSGLGLSIVREVAGQHGASVALSDPPGGGLRVQVEFLRCK